MNHRWLLSVALAVSLGCSPAADDKGSTGSGGAKATGGGSGGARASGGSGGSNVGTGGSSVSTGGSGVSTGGVAGGSGGAAGGSGGSKADAAPGTGGRPGSGGASGQPDGGNAMGGPAGVLHNYVLTVPCPAGAMGGSCSPPVGVRAFDKMLTFGGNPATTYKVTLKMCGLFETRPYNNCKPGSMNPRHCIDGTAGTQSFAPTYPTLGLKVGAPAATHYINGMWQADTIVKIDYTATIEITGGTTLNFISDGGSNGGIYTQRMKANLTCPEVPGVMQPYAGQFMHFQVMSVDPAM